MKAYEDSLLYSNVIILVVPVTGWVGGGVDPKSKYPSIGPFPGIFRVTETSRRLLVFVENTEVSLTMGGWAGSKSTEKRPLRVSKTKKQKNIYRSDTGASKVQRFIKEQWCWITPLLRCLGVACGGSWGLASCDNLKELHLSHTVLIGFRTSLFHAFQGTKSIETVDVLHHSVRIQVPLDQNLLSFRSGLITWANGRVS